MFKLDQGRYPTKEEGLEILRSNGDSITPNWKQYLKELPVDSWGNSYVYEIEKSDSGEVVKLLSTITSN